MTKIPLRLSGACPRCECYHEPAVKQYAIPVRVGGEELIAHAWCESESAPVFFVQVPSPSEADVVRALQQLVNAAAAREKAHPNDMVAVTQAQRGVVEATRAAQDVLDRWHDRVTPKYRLL